MGGGQIQLAAIGPQDIYLTGNPQITYFKAVYKRHTNFAIETVALFANNMDFGRTPEIEIPITGDLISDIHIELKLPQLHQTTHGSVTSTYASYVDGIGNALIKSVELRIGGSPIDKQYGEWLDIWGELNVKPENRKTYDIMVGNTYPSDDSDPENFKSRSQISLYIPLRFWFNNNPGLAIPIIALQYHKITLQFEFEEVKHLIRSNVTITTPKDNSGNDLKFLNPKLLVDYIYLDTDEKRRFTQVSHEYLIETIQHIDSILIQPNTELINLDLTFNNPVKYIVWVIQNANFLKHDSGVNASITGDANDFKRKNCGNQKLRYSNLANIEGKYDNFKTAKIQINGYDRIAEKNADYFRLVQNQQFMGCTPSKYIYSYSFALNANKHQPSGTCNFSRLDDANLNLVFDTKTQALNKNSATTPALYIGQIQQEREIKIYAMNYNILRIMGGTAGLAYAR